MLYFKECGINAAKILSAECLDSLILALFIMFHLHGIFRHFMYQQCRQIPLFERDLTVTRASMTLPVVISVWTCSHNFNVL